MTDDYESTTACRCHSVKDALGLALQGKPAPACPQHDTEPGTPEPIALNNDAALAAKIGASLAKKGD